MGRVSTAVDVQRAIKSLGRQALLLGRVFIDGCRVTIVNRICLFSFGIGRRLCSALSSSIISACSAKMTRKRSFAIESEGFPEAYSRPGTGTRERRPHPTRSTRLHQHFHRRPLTTPGPTLYRQKPGAHRPSRRRLRETRPQARARAHRPAPMHHPNPWLSLLPKSLGKRMKEIQTTDQTTTRIRTLAMNLIIRQRVDRLHDRPAPWWVRTSDSPESVINCGCYVKDNDIS